MFAQRLNLKLGLNLILYISSLRIVLNFSKANKNKQPANKKLTKLIRFSLLLLL
jgi:hypothetical protein